MLEVNNIDAGYGNMQILWDVSFSVEQGEVVAIIGPNGVGKTTSLRCIAGKGMSNSLVRILPDDKLTK